MASLISGLTACGVQPAAPEMLSTIAPPFEVQTAWSGYLPETPTQVAIIQAAVTVRESMPPAALLQTSIPTFMKTPTPIPSALQSRLPTRTLKPTAKITPTVPACLETQGHIETGSLSTDLLRAPLVYRIYLPPCYAQDRQHRYPVLYLFHGQGFRDDQWDRIGADETADQLIASHQIPPLIIVMPYEHYGDQPGEGNFSQAIVEQLVPHLDQAYRTKPDSKHRAVGGLSRGGGWAIHFAMVHWDVFGALGGHSAAVFFADAEQMRTYIDSIPSESLPRIYLDIGERDRPEILRAAIWLEQLLNEKDVPHEWHLFSGYHNETYWAEHMAQYLYWYTQGW